MRDKLVEFETTTGGEEEEGAGRPDWLLEKFTSPEDQARAYADAEREMSRLRSEMEREREQFSEALQNMENLQVAPPQQNVYSPEQDPLLQQYQQAVDVGDARAMLAIQLELNRQQTEQAVRSSLKDYDTKFERSSESDREVAITLATERVARDYENWQEIAPKIGDFLQENQHWIPEGASVEGFERVLHQAAKLVMADDLIAARRNEEASRQEKLNTQVLQGLGGGRTPTPDEAKVEWDKIKSINLGGYSGIMGG
jgi:hypothetical protein